MINPWDATMDLIGKWSTTLAEVPEDPSDPETFWRIVAWCLVGLTSFALSMLVLVLRE